MAVVSSWWYVKGKSSNMIGANYEKSTEQASSYNAKMSAERRLRLPFLDLHTRVGQNHRHLFHSYLYRQPGKTPDIIYTYPAAKWKKKKRAQSLNPPCAVQRSEEESDHQAHEISIQENSVVSQINSAKELSEPTSIAEKWYKYDEFDEEPPDLDHHDVMNSDGSEYEDYPCKKKKKKSTSTSKKRSTRSSKGRKDDSVDDVDKQFLCTMCSMRYKTRPGLSYHMTHTHKKSLSQVTQQAIAKRNEAAEEDKKSYADLVASKELPTATHDRPPNIMPMGSNINSKGEPKAKSNDYCDFCLGIQLENKKTGKNEELVSCADCGRSGHPTCLQFTDNMVISVKKYPWQCIECKSCGLCGTSDNDDQLLFCDDCDRGYHMYCLKPPITEPPEGSWSCHLCVVEFHHGKKQ